MTGESVRSRLGELGQCFQVGEPGSSDAAGISKVERREVGQPFQMRQPLVGYSGTAEVQFREVIQPFQMGQASIVHLRKRDVQLREFRQGRTGLPDPEFVIRVTATPSFVRLFRPLKRNSPASVTLLPCESKLREFRQVHQVR